MATYLPLQRNIADDLSWPGVWIVVPDPRMLRLHAQAFRRLARCRHPDKGGSAVEFAALRDAFETLSDPQRRAVYDLQASHAGLRRGVDPEFQVGGGGEHVGRWACRG